MKKYIFLFLSCCLLAACSNTDNKDNQNAKAIDTTAYIPDSVFGGPYYAEDNKEYYKECRLRDSLAKISADAYFSHLIEELQKINPNDDNIASHPHLLFGKFELEHFKGLEGGDIFPYFFNVVKSGDYYMIQFFDGESCVGEDNYYIIDKHFKVTDKREYEEIGCYADEEEEEEEESQQKSDTIQHYIYCQSNVPGFNGVEISTIVDDGFKLYSLTKYEITDTTNKNKYYDYDMIDTLTVFGINPKGHFYVRKAQRFTFNADTMLAKMKKIQNQN